MVKTLIYIFIFGIFVEIIKRDMREKIILNKSNLALLFCGIILGIMEKNLTERVLGAAVYTIPFILIYGYGSDYLEKECLGMGDIKLITSLGMLLKFKNLFKVLLFINISFVTPLIFLLGKYLLTKKIDKEIAFGPFLILAYILILILERYDN